jgi:hypothetical protein
VALVYNCSIPGNLKDASDNPLRLDAPQAGSLDCLQRQDRRCSPRSRPLVCDCARGGIDSSFTPAPLGPSVAITYRTGMARANREIFTVLKHSNCNRRDC